MKKGDKTTLEYMASIGAEYIGITHDHQQRIFEDKGTLYFLSETGDDIVVDRVCLDLTNYGSLLDKAMKELEEIKNE